MTAEAMAADGEAQGNESEVASISRRMIFTIPGVTLVVAAFLSALISFAVLLGLTPVEPVDEVVLGALVVNLVFVAGLIILVYLEIRSLLRARRRGKAAAKLHIRIVALFSIVAIVPAILVAVVASITLDVGLDRWFSLRTKSIVNSSLSVAEAYVLENARFLQGQTVSMANDLDNARTLYSLDRVGFQQFMTRQAVGRGLLGAFLVREDGSVIVTADRRTERPLPAVPLDALTSAARGEPTLIPPGVTNLVGAVMPLQEIEGTFLYTVRSVDPEVMRSMRLMEDATKEYQTLEEGRFSLQLAFGILYLGFALIVLLAAIWTAIAVADRLVRPIRTLIGAAADVTRGNLDVVVPVYTSDGDVGSLAHTFNNMIVEIRTQRDEILEAKDQIDDRRRFTEAVLTGVTAGVVGIGYDGRITIANRSATQLLGTEGDEDLPGRSFAEAAPEFDTVMAEAYLRPRGDTRGQVTLRRGGKERHFDVKVTREEAHDGMESFVVTFDDITDLLIAQRSTAWADVARRIAHEIKNPLTPIQLSAERIRRRYGRQIPDEDRAVFDQCTDTIVRQVEDIGRMVDEFSSFARMPKPSKQRSDLRDILKDAVFLREVSRNDITFEREVPDEPLWGDFDPRMLGQAFGNLIKNASEAIDSVPSDEERDGRRILVRAVRHDDGDYVIDIIDNGRGLPAENRNRLLEPYMTMREKGTGLGLAIVKKIIEDHGGSIQLGDAPSFFDGGKGAMITVRLPQQSSTPDADDASPGPAADTMERETIDGL